MGCLGLMFKLSLLLKVCNNIASIHVVEVVHDGREETLNIKPYQLFD